VVECLPCKNKVLNSNPGLTKDKKMKNRKVKQVLFRGGSQWEGEGKQRRRWGGGGEYGLCTLYVGMIMTMTPVKTVLRIGERGLVRMMEGMNLTKVHSL
jgi:hypothetical protein